MNPYGEVHREGQADVGRLEGPQGRAHDAALPAVLPHHLVRVQSVAVHAHVQALVDIEPDRL